MSPSSDGFSFKQTELVPARNDHKLEWDRNGCGPIPATIATDERSGVGEEGGGRFRLVVEAIDGGLSERWLGQAAAQRRRCARGCRQNIFLCRVTAELFYEMPNANHPERRPS
jgi:hypothetical protein